MELHIRVLDGVCGRNLCAGLVLDAPNKAGIMLQLEWYQRWSARFAEAHLASNDGFE